MNLKKVYWRFKKERLSVRTRGGRKRMLGTWAPMTVPQGANQRFVQDALNDGRRFLLNVVASLLQSQR